MNRDNLPEEVLKDTKRIYPVRLSSLISAYTVGLILLFALALAFVGQRSSAEADRQAYAHDIALFDNTLNNRFALMARDQHSLAAWDGHLRGRTGDTGGLIGALWYEFGHDRAILIDPAGKVAAYAREGALDPDPGALALDPELQLLVDRARRHFEEALAEAGGDAGRVSGNVFEAAFETIEDQPAMLSAMPVLLDGVAEPAVLISAKFVDGDLLEYLDTQLSFNALHFNVNPPEGLPPTHKLIATPSGTPLGAFVWKSRYPGAAIWSVILPLILAVAAVLALTALVAARRLGAMTNVVETSERRTRHMSRHDALTGLANRLRFGEELKAAVEAVEKQPFAVIAADLDRFKAVNDTYGHAAGDVVIRTVARRLADAVGEAGLVSRTGGDEFIMLIRAYTDRPRLEALAARIIAAVPQPITVETGTDGEAETDVGVSLGIAQAPDCGRGGAEVMRAADEALYEAKEAGRGIAVFAEDRMLRHSWREAKGRDADGPGVAPSARLKRAR